MVFLKGLGFLVGIRADSLDADRGSVGRGDGRHVRDAVLDGAAADVAVVDFAFASDRRIDDELDLVVLDHVKDVGTPFAELADYGVRDAVLGEEGGGAFGGEDAEPELMDLLRDGEQVLAVVAADGHQHGALGGQEAAGSGLGLEERGAEVVGNAHDFARGAHFRAEDRVDFREHVERQDGLLDGDEYR